MDEPQPDDAALVRRTLAGDREAFGVLVERYEKLLGSLCRQRVRTGRDAEDVVQEVFLKAYVALGELRDARRFGAWLYNIAFRATVDHLRRRARRGVVVSLERYAEDGGQEPAAPGEAMIDRAARREEGARVLGALGELPDAYRLVLTLRYQRHMSYREIAEHLGEPDGTIANRIHRAAAKLRQRLEATTSGAPAAGGG